MLNLGWEMSVIRIFEWHYLYKFPEYFKYKTSFLPVAYSTWAWPKRGKGVGTGGRNPCPQDAYRPTCSKVSAIFLLLLTILPANILYMIMISEDLLTFLFLVLFPCITFLASTISYMLLLLWTLYLATSDLFITFQFHESKCLHRSIW